MNPYFHPDLRAIHAVDLQRSDGEAMNLFPNFPWVGHIFSSHLALCLASEDRVVSGYPVRSFFSESYISFI